MRKLISFTIKKRLLISILACYLFAGLLAVDFHSVLSILERDGTEFLFDALRILNGRGYDSDFWPFGYMVTIAVLKFLTSIDYFIIGKIITLVSGIGVLVLTYLICKKVFFEKIALLAIIILATNHLFFLHSFLVETDMFFVFFFLLSIYCLIQGPDLKYFFWAGATTGLAYMIKYGVYAIFPVVMILIFIDCINYKVGDSLKKLIVFFTAFIIFSSPWLIYNTVKNDNPFYSKHYLNIAWGMNRPQPLTKEYWGEYHQLSNQYHSMKDVLSDTKKFLRNWKRNFTELPNNIILILPLIGFFVLPGYLMIFKSLNRRKLILILTSFGFLSLITIAYTWNRYLLPILPVLSMFIGYCIYNILPVSLNLDKIYNRCSLTIPFRWVLITLFILFSITFSFKKVRGAMIKHQSYEFKIVGEWLKERLGNDDWLMVPESIIAWYAGTDKFVMYPSRHKNINLDEAVKRREQNLSVFTQEALSSTVVTNINYFIYDKRYYARLSRNGFKIPENFNQVFYVKGSKTEIVIYQIDYEFDFEMR